MSDPDPPGRVWRLPAIAMRVETPAALCLQVIAGAGTLVEHRSSTERVVEFRTRLRRRTIVTTELVRFAPPRISYRWLDGPLPYVRESIEAVALGPDRTELRYEGAFSMGSGLRDRLLVPWVRWQFRRQVRRHLRDAKQLSEERYARSHVFRPGA